MKKIYSSVLTLVALLLLGHLPANGQCTFNTQAGSGTALTTVGVAVSVYTGQDANGIHGHYTSIFLAGGYQYQLKQYLYSGCCGQVLNTGYYITVTDSVNNILQAPTATTYFTFSTKTSRTVRFHISHTSGCTASSQSSSFFFYLDVTNQGHCPNSYRDLDGDGYGDPTDSLLYDACPSPSPGYAANNTDCDDNNPAAHANALWYVDNDHDGFGDAADMGTNSCGDPSSRLTTNFAGNNMDCDDTNPLIGPQSMEIEGNSIDENCDGALSNTENALNFYGSYISVAHNASIDLDTTFTIEALIRRNSGQYLTIMDKGAYMYLFQVQNDKLGFYANSTGPWYFSNDTVPTGQWVHVAVTHHANDSITFYIDGQYSGGANNVFPQHDNGPLNVGQQGPTNCGCWPFYGDMDEVRVWKTVRTPAELNAYKSTSLCGSENGLVLYYKFDQGIAGGNNTSITTVKDFSPYANNGTLTNFNLNAPISNFVTGAVVTPAYANISIVASTDTLCTGDSLLLNGTGGTTYYWSTNATSGSYFTPAATVTYYLLGTDSIGCRNLDSATIVVQNCQAAQSISFPAIPVKIFGDPDFALNATASSGLPVSYSSNDPLVATVSGNIVTITGAGTATITATQPGDASFFPAAPEQQVLIVNSPTGIQTASMENGILIYPDPVQDQLTIRLTNPSNASVTISDAIGQTVYAASLNSTSISLSHLAPGIYNLIVYSGGNTYARKIVKQ